METCCGYRYDRVRQHGTNLLTLPSDFHGQSGAHRTPQQVWSYAGIRRPYLRPTRFQGTHSVKKKRQLFPGLPPTSPSSFALPPTAEAASALRFGNFNPIPFRGLVPSIPWCKPQGPPPGTGTPSRQIGGTSPSLRTDLPVSNCCSHGTLLHFSLQDPPLNICYYHQDPHRKPLRPCLRHGLHCHVVNVGTSEPSYYPGHAHFVCPAGVGQLGATLQRHPFSGLVDSAGESLHTP